MNLQSHYDQKMARNDLKPGKIKRIKHSGLLEFRGNMVPIHIRGGRSPRRAFESAGIEFIDENGGGLGVRLRKRQRLKKPK